MVNIKNLNYFIETRIVKMDIKHGVRIVEKKKQKNTEKNIEKKYLKLKREWYKKTKTEIEIRNKRALELIEKKCTSCEEIKEIKQFRQRANGGYYSVCKQCENKKNKEYRKNNPDKINELKVISENRRRYQKSKLDKSLTSKEWNECKKFFNNECAYCGRKMNNLTQDHFIPLSKDGEYSKKNIIPSCRSCNSRKNNKDFYEWYKEDIHYSKERLNKIEEYFRSLA